MLVPFDNILDTDEVMMVNEDQIEMGGMSASCLIKEHGRAHRQDPRGARPARQLGRSRPPSRLPRGRWRSAGNKFEIVEVVGNWDDGTSQKVVADALAVHGQFDGMFTQGGSTARCAR